jgi:hypothetical protein
VKRTTLRIVAALALLVPGACVFGTRLEQFAPAHGPQGATVSLRTHERELEGELLEARDEGLLLLEAVAPGLRGTAGTGRRLVLVRYARIRRARFAGVGLGIFDGNTPKARDLRRMRQLSRFPQGVAPELLQALLGDCAQQAVGELP